MLLRYTHELFSFSFSFLFSILLFSFFFFLQNSNKIKFKGTFDAFNKICEDCSQEMDSEALGWPLNALIPKFIQFFDSPVGKIRYHAIHCINQFIHLKPQALLVNLNSFIQVFFFSFFLSFNKNHKQKTHLAITPN